MWTIPRAQAEPAGPDLLGLLTDDELGLILQACSLRTLRVVKAVSRRLRQAGRRALCSPCWRAKAVNLDELRMHAWVVGGFDCRELAGHKALADVYGVALCGGAIASCSWDGTARLWDASSGGCERTFRPRSPTAPGGGAGPVHCVALAPGALACADPSGTVHVWGLGGGQEEAPATELHGHVRNVTGLAWAGGVGAGHSRVYRPLLLSGGLDRTLRLWDVAQGGRQLAASAKEHPRPVRSLAVDEREGDVASGGEEGTVRLWSLTPSQLAPVRALEGHSGAVLALLLRGALVVSAASDRSVRLWDARAGGGQRGSFREPALFSGGGEVRALALCGHALVAGGAGRDLHLFDLRKLKLAATLRGHVSKVNALAMDGGRLVSGDGAGRVRRWQLDIHVDEGGVESTHGTGSARR